MYLAVFASLVPGELLACYLPFVISADVWHIPSTTKSSKQWYSTFTPAFAKHHPNASTTTLKILGAERSPKGNMALVLSNTYPTPCDQ